MARIALVGEGPIPGPGNAETRFASLRFDWFRTALADHEVLLFDSRHPVDRVAWSRAQRCDAIVSAGVYGPTRTALQLVDDQPLWIDLPGDPFADAQAVGALTDPEAVAREAAAVFLPALARADAFSTISSRSRFSLLGQLGALGRLARTRPGEEWAWIVPIPWSFGSQPERLVRAHAGNPRRVLLAGSFNTWFDAETALASLLLAMDQADVEAHITGGPVPGHHVEDYTRFQTGARASRHAGRFHFHGWLEETSLGDVVAACDVLLCLDRPGFEPELGSRTRVLFALHQGLAVVATPRSELVHDLARDGFVCPVPLSDPAATAAALLHAHPPPERAALRTTYDVDAVVAPLRAWAAAPVRRRPAPEAGALLDLVHERDALIREIDRIRKTPTWRLLNRLTQVRRR